MDRTNCLADPSHDHEVPAMAKISATSTLNHSENILIAVLAFVLFVSGYDLAATKAHVFGGLLIPELNIIAIAIHALGGLPALYVFKIIFTAGPVAFIYVNRKRISRRVACMVIAALLIGFGAAAVVWGCFLIVTGLLNSSP